MTVSWFLDGLGGVREGQLRRDRGDLQGAPFGAAVAFLAGLVCDGDLFPGQGTTPVIPSASRIP
jgi:hypothetical protein